MTLAYKLWRGEASLDDHHPVSPQNVADLAEVKDGVAFPTSPSAEKPRTRSAKDDA